MAGCLLPALEPWLHNLPTCPSTNSWAIAHLEQLNHGDVVFTRQQTAGRGQHNSVWYSDAGVFTASFVLTDIAVERLTGLSLAVGVTVIELVSRLLPDLATKLQLKWSNDLILMGSKVGGILCEAKTEAQIAKVVIGIGLNLDPRKLSLANSTSLSQWTSLQIPCDWQLLRQIRNSLLQLQPLADILVQFRRRDFLLGKQISLQLGNITITGLAIGISDRGELQLRLANGEIKQLSSGHIFEINGQHTNSK